LELAALAGRRGAAAVLPADRNQRLEFTVKAKTFVAMALAAAASSIAAIAVYTSNNQWAQGHVAGAKLLPALATGTQISSIAVAQGGNALTLDSRDGRWVIKERSGYPAEPEKIRALLVKLSKAELIEAKTRNPDRYAMLELEDPAAKNAKSRSVRLLDGKGGTVAEVVVGKRRWDAFGSGKGGTYVRIAGDPQTWLADAEFDVNPDVKAWIKPNVFEIESAKINRLTIEIPGEDPLRVERGGPPDSKASFVGLPEGKKLKDSFAADSVLRAVSTIDAEDVRKIDAQTTSDGVNRVSLSTSEGLEVTIRVRKDGDAAWVSLEASGDREAKSAAEAIKSRAGGWEFKIPGYKADAMLKRRNDMLESS
jgi:hypothetical protein